MQDLDNHTDDLFRNAAENYLPSPGESDWYKIARILAEKDPVFIAPKKYNIRFKITAALLLLLLLAGGRIIFNYFSTANTNNNLKITAAKNAQKSIVAAPQSENKIPEKNSKNIGTVKPMF